MPHLRFDGTPNPFEDIHAFTQKIREKRPGISDLGVNILVKRAVGLRRTRQKGYILAVAGADIMTEHPEYLPIWGALPPSLQRRILAHPLNGGTTLEEYEDAKLARMELVGSLNYAQINRSVLISPRGLQQTYAWSERTQWIQEVTPRDYELLLSLPDMRSVLRDPELVGPYRDIRSYDAPVKDQFIAKDASDVRALVRQYSRTPQYGGFDVKKD